MVPRRGLRPWLLVMVASSLLFLSGCQLSVSDWMFARTGEETLLRQLRGMGQLALNVTHPRPRTAPESAVAQAGAVAFGINTFLEQEVELWKRERSLQMISDAGFRWIRQEFPWEDIEIHGKDDFEDRRHEPHRSAWDKYDHIVGLADKYDVGIIARLSNPPAWTRSDGDAQGTYSPPDSLADWGDYVHAVVSRYRGTIRYYQLWNEPNIYPEWGEQPVDPEAYTRLLCEGYRRAKEADPDAVIVAGALAPTVSLSRGPGPGLGLNEFVFLQRMYDAGAAACFDVLAVNDYMLWSGPTDHRMRPLIINYARPAYIRDIMVANDDAEKPIWISEMNSNAVPDDPNIQGWGAYGQVTPEQQARYAVLAYQRGMEEWPWAGVVSFWFFKRASDAEQDQSWYYFRMVEPDFAPLPVYEAMRDYTSGLAPTLYPGTHQEDHWALEYVPPPRDDDGWETVESAQLAYGPQYRRVATPGAALRIVYEGTDLALLPGPASGVVEVSVDGGPPRQVVLDGEPVWLVGGGPLAPLAGWRRQRHEVVVRAVEGEFGVDGIRVHRPSNLWVWLILLALALGLVAAWALVRGRRRQGPASPKRN